MRVPFWVLGVGDRFYLSDVEHIKLDNRIYGGRLSSRPINAINLSNKHLVVIGPKVLVDRKD